MKPLPKHVYVLFTSVLLAGCGMDVKAVYDRSLYHTTIFKDNFYVDTLLTSTFAPSQLRGMTTALTIDAANVNQTIPTSNDDPNGDDYAFNNQLSNALPSLDYGIESKLFDGILYCTDAVRASKSRLQLLPSGMGYQFSKSIETSSTQTLGFFMKAGADTNAGGQHLTEIMVTFTLFKSFEDGYQATEIIIPITDLKATFFPGYYEVSLPNHTLEGTVGFAFQYAITAPVPEAEKVDLTGVFLYEVLMPTATFAE